MAQHDQVIDNGPGASVRSDINAAVSALFSCSSGSVEPNTTVAGQLWWDSTNSVLNVRNQPNTAWLPIAVNVGASYLPITGGTATGQITIKPAAASANMILVKPQDTLNAAIFGQLAGTPVKNRWGMFLGNNTSESGGNAGSDFQIWRYDDAGAAIQAALTISRATGAMTVSQNLNLTAPASTDYALLSGSRNNGSNSLPTLRLLGNTVVSGVGKARWAMDLGNATNETGSNNGSDFSLYSYNDAATVSTLAMNIDRGTNIATFPKGVGVTTGFYMNLATTVSPAVRQLVMDLGSDFRYTPGDGFRWYYSSTMVGRITGSGDLIISGDTATKSGGSASWITTSDERIKENIEDYGAGLEEILQLRPRTFTYKPETGIPGTVNVGLIAQEIETVMPETVLTGSGTVGSIELADMKSLDTGPLVFALINAVKELTDRVESLEGQLTAAKRRTP